MKQILFTLLFISLFQFVGAQAPESFQFQAVVRETDGTVTAEKDIVVRFKIRQENVSGATVFIDNHETKTDKTGVFNLQIGKGNVEHGSIADINWANGPYFIEIEVDKGSGFTILGTQQLLSVPYAQYSKNAENVQIKSSNGKLWNIIINDDGAISTKEITQ